MDVTIHHLRCFLAVAEELHFGRAARRLQLSPSSLSEQIGVLERRLDRSLFRRTSRCVALTADGVELVALARRATAAVEDVLTWARGTDEEPELRVGLMVASTAVTRIMARAAEELPSVRWRVRQLGFVGCLEALADGEVDCVFAAEIGADPDPRFTAAPLWNERCVLVTSERHRFAERASVRVAELAGETFVSTEDGSDRSAGTDGAAPTRWFDAVGVTGKWAPVARNFEEILELCAAGQGVNIAGESARTTYARDGVRFVPIADAPAATVRLYVPRAGRRSALERFVEVSRQVAG